MAAVPRTRRIKGATEHQRRPSLLLDVREDWEYQICHLEGSRNCPVSQVPTLLEELDPDTPTVVICHHGVRSQHVAEFL
ncbi:MAG: rhodanese-like domain-containing protein, partial [Gammaproteobacteria bacterium]